MAKPEDLTGKKYGKLICLKIAPKRKQGEGVRWECLFALFSLWCSIGEFIIKPSPVYAFNFNSVEVWGEGNDGGGMIRIQPMEVGYKISELSTENGTGNSPDDSSGNIFQWSLLKWVQVLIGSIIGSIIGCIVVYLILWRPYLKKMGIKLF